MGLTYSKIIKKALFLILWVEYSCYIILLILSHPSALIWPIIRALIAFMIHERHSLSSNYGVCTNFVLQSVQQNKSFIIQECLLQSVMKCCKTFVCNKKCYSIKSLQFIKDIHIGQIKITTLLEITLHF